MTEVTREQVLGRLSQVKGPDLNSDIVSLGLVENVLVSDNKVIFSISVPAEQTSPRQAIQTANDQAPKLRVT